MPQILLVKTSSLGDVIHNLPVVNDIRRELPGAEIDWVVEDALEAIPRLHGGVRTVIPASPRRWRAAFWRSGVRGEMRAFRRRIQAARYDAVLDTQGLVKSACIAWLARGPRFGLDFASAREPLALFYDRTFSVPWTLHAVERNRSLAAQALGYRCNGAPDYGIVAASERAPWLPRGDYAVLVHSSSNAHKLWDERDWVRLGAHLRGKGLAAVLPWWGPAERERSERLAQQIEGARIAPALGLAECARVIAGSRAVIGVDSGLTHLAAALKVPVIGIYRATDPAATGICPGGGPALNLGAIGRAPSAAEVIAGFDSLRAA